MLSTYVWTPLIIKELRKYLGSSVLGIQKGGQNWNNTLPITRDSSEHRIAWNGVIFSIA